MRVPVAGGIEPVAGLVLAVPAALQQPINRLFVGLRRRVGQEGVEFSRGGGQAGEIQRHPPEQGGLVGLGGGFEPLRLQAGQHELIDRVADKARVGDDRRIGRLGRDERPMGLHRGPFGDPAANQLNLGRCHFLPRGRRGHDLIGIGRHQAGEQLAGVGLLGHHGGRARRLNLQHICGDIQPQACLPLLLIGTVALEAQVGQERANLAAVIDRPIGGVGRREDWQQTGGRQQSQQKSHSGERMRAKEGREEHAETPREEDS